MTQSFHDHVNEFLDSADRDMLQKGGMKICLSVQFMSELNVV